MAFIPTPNTNDFSEKLKYALRCIFPTVLVLQVTIFNVGRMRSKTKTNPLAGDQSKVTAQKAILANTLEQFVIYIGLNMVLITFLDPAEMKIIPLYTLVFVVGRFLFILGYPNRRGYGMFMNFGSTAFFGCLIIYFMFSRGFMYDIPFDPVNPISGSSGKTEL